MSLTPVVCLTTTNEVIWERTSPWRYTIFREFCTLYLFYGCEAITGILRIWVILKIDQYSAILIKRTRWELSICVAEHISRENQESRTYFDYFSRYGGLCSAISIKRTRWELSINVAEHRSILKNKGVGCILIIFEDGPLFSHIIWKDSTRAFDWCGWT